MTNVWNIYHNSMKLHDDQLKIEFIKQLFSIDNVLLLNKNPRGIKKKQNDPAKTMWIKC